MILCIYLIIFDSIFKKKRENILNWAVSSQPVFGPNGPNQLFWLSKYWQHCLRGTISLVQRCVFPLYIYICIFVLLLINLQSSVLLSSNVYRSTEFPRQKQHEFVYSFIFNSPEKGNFELLQFSNSISRWFLYVLMRVEFFYDGRQVLDLVFLLWLRFFKLHLEFDSSWIS